ncbi:NADH-quinone oxidoreductase subunit L [Salinisphaera sp. LB1]|uniref:NADH-quinone oxidoreductase subunit L n=1 Tax=Salinisphaera sp. LB1 TaxID=2183911 RepID=UPI000D708A4B|nr:NADH-quinone oxidoreductase subunit L [Salinisphaera sp. LB1]AWN16219.1 NADH dehydrogenase, subunit 5 [Salinisphaera sp. LB1]
MYAIDTTATALFALSVPVTYLWAAIASGDRRGPVFARWPATLVYARCAIGFTIALALLYLVTAKSPTLSARLPWPHPTSFAPSVRVDPVTLAMLALISFIGLVILTFSRQYLAGDPNADDPEQHVYRRWFCATLASISTLVVANQLLLLGVAWVATSLCLHQLLIYYHQRPQALLAAHKKFLISRVADAFILVGLILVGMHYGSFQMDRVFARVEPTAFTPTLTLATALIACAAILKCAQLPFHGWLIQVMEAPTPVSALLHAGIVNMGGFLMIRLAPLMAHAGLAQALLVIAGTTTAVVTALIMTTRVSVKVMLAWSTCAQMGFMLMECGLGLYNLAMLHLLAHSFYKAHCFLTAGEMVATSTRRSCTPASAKPSGARWLFIAGIAGGVIFGLFAIPSLGRGHPAVFAVLVLAIASLIGEGANSREMAWRTGAGALAVTGLYLLWSFLSTFWAPPTTTAPSMASEVGITLAFGALFILRAMLTTAGGARRLAWLQPHVYGGFYLDQLFTRLTLVIWPPRLPARAPLATTPPSPTRSTAHE